MSCSFETSFHLCRRLSAFHLELGYYSLQIPSVCHLFESSPQGKFFDRSPKLSLTSYRFCCPFRLFTSVNSQPSFTLVHFWSASCTFGSRMEEPSLLASFWLQILRLPQGLGSFDLSGASHWVLFLHGPFLITCLIDLKPFVTPANAKEGVWNRPIIVRYKTFWKSQVDGYPISRLAIA